MRDLHPRAQDEINEALRWYMDRSLRVADRFDDDLREGLLEIEMFPDRFARYILKTRLYIMPRFPYLIVYLAKPEKIIVVAVAHAKRRPGYWRRRLRSL